MTDIRVKQMPAFKKMYKKLHAKDKSIVDNAIRDIIQDPKVGEEKKGDLIGVFVYKFKLYNQEILLAYTWDPVTGVLIALGVHEDFYRDLKRVNA